MLSKKINPLLFRGMLFCMLGFSVQQVSAQSEFSTIMDRIRTDFSSATISSLDNSVTTHLGTLSANGSWPDINYADQSATNWQPGNHWVRVSTFCKAYSRTGSSYYGSRTLRQAIINSMNYWLNLSPAANSSNWYMLGISLPKDIGEALVAMRYGTEPLTSEMENAVLNWMIKGVPITQSPAKDGSNLTEVAYHYIIRACLTQDQALLTQAISATTNGALVIVNNGNGNVGEGIQADNSFTAHGPQLYIYGYGVSLISSVSSIAKLVTGTSYAFSADKIAIFSSFVRGSFMKASRGIYADYNVFNRSISRPNSGTAGRWQVVDAKGIDLPEYAAEYDLAISRMAGSKPPSYNVTPEHIHFWRTDYTVHHRTKYMFGLRSVSTRTVKAENGNGESLKGYYLTEGANYIAVNGNEYYNIYPTWEWNKIPGTTVPEITSYPLRPQWNSGPGTSAFVGGVSNGQYGASTFAMNDYNTQAKKSWFFFDDEVVCLGAGISSTATEAINTTVNQCLLDGSVNIKTSEGAEVLATGSRQYTGNLQWVHHDSVGYFFPQGGSISLSNQTQTGTWQSINTTYSGTVSKDVFKLWFQHGIKPANSSYSYIVTPGKTLAEMNAYDASVLQVWSNTAAAQAVYHSGLDMLQVVFYQAGSLTQNGITVTANIPCVLLLKNVSTGNVQVSVSDPTQTKSAVAIGVQNNVLGALRTFSGSLPTGLLAGKTLDGFVDINTAVVNTPAITIQTELQATGDAYVRDGSSAATNFPTGNLVIKNDAAGFARRVFIQFDLSSNPTDLTAFAKSLDSAFLRLRVVSANATVTSTNWEFYEVPDNSWTETGINWNNQPAIGGNLLASVQGKAVNNYISIPLPQALINKLINNKKISVRVTSTVLGGTTDASFGSKENTTTSFRPTILLYGKIDLSAPVITAPADITVNTDAGTAVASGVVLGVPIATDDSGIKSISNNAPATFPVGTTVVTWTATDNADLRATAIQKVTVKDLEVPAITAPANVAVNTDAGIATASNVSLGTATATDNHKIESITNNAPATFPVGVTTVTWTAIDSSGNTATTTQTVTVTDAEAPVVNAAANQTFCFSGHIYTIPLASASDNTTLADISFVIAGATQRSGNGIDASGQFNAGLSIITWTATDIHGNAATAQTTVTVNHPVHAAIADVYALNAAVDAKNTLYIGYGPSSLTLTATVQGGTADYQYSWSNGQQTQSAPVSSEGMYTVVVTDAKGCQATASIEIKILDVRCGNDNSKVKICHNDKTICVADDAVQEHLNHGDHVGACGVAGRACSNCVVSASVINVYPNPVNNILYVQVPAVQPGAEINLYNSLGMLVRSERLTTARKEMSLVGLASGLYHVHIKNGSEVYQKKIVKL